MTDRSTRRETRNPILGLPTAVEALASLGPAEKAALRAVLLACRADARDRANECWRKHKAPMAAYWKAASVYMGHIAGVLREGQKADQSTFI